MRFETDLSFLACEFSSLCSKTARNRMNFKRTTFPVGARLIPAPMTTTPCLVGSSQSAERGMINAAPRFFRWRRAIQPIFIGASSEQWRAHPPNGPFSRSRTLWGSDQRLE